MKRVYFFGRKYRCNICGSSLRIWQWHGEDSAVHGHYKMVGSGRRRCLCPICHSIDRERFLMHYLKKEIDPFSWKQLRILHMAPESGISKWIKDQQPLCYVQGDFLAKGYHYSPEVVELDVQDLPFDVGAFDLIICSHVLEHVKNDQKAHSELIRVLSSRGVLLIMVPRAADLALSIEGTDKDSEEYRLEKFGQLDHLRLYGNDVVSRFSSRTAGEWCVEEMHLGEFGVPLGVQPLEVLFIFKKMNENG